MSFSDVLGNHRFDAYTGLYGDLSNSDLLVNYFYLPKQTNMGVTAFQTVFFFGTQDGSVARDRSFGLNFILSRPFNRYRRIDFNLMLMGIEREWVYGEGTAPAYQRNVLYGNVEYITDTSLWGFTGPVSGTRSNFQPGTVPDSAQTAWTF